MKHNLVLDLREDALMPFLNEEGQLRRAQDAMYAIIKDPEKMQASLCWGDTVVVVAYIPGNLHAVEVTVTFDQGGTQYERRILTDKPC